MAQGCRTQRGTSRSDSRRRLAPASASRTAKRSAPRMPAWRRRGPTTLLGGLWWTCASWGRILTPDQQEAYSCPPTHNEPAFRREDPQRRLHTLLDRRFAGCRRARRRGGDVGGAVAQGAQREDEIIRPPLVLRILRCSRHFALRLHELVPERLLRGVLIMSAASQAKVRERRLATARDG